MHALIVFLANKSLKKTKLLKQSRQAVKVPTKVEVQNMEQVLSSSEDEVSVREAFKLCPIMEFEFNSHQFLKRGLGIQMPRNMIVNIILGHHQVGKTRLIQSLIGGEIQEQSSSFRNTQVYLSRDGVYYIEVNSNIESLFLEILIEISSHVIQIVDNGDFNQIPNQFIIFRIKSQLQLDEVKKGLVPTINKSMFYGEKGQLYVFYENFWDVNTLKEQLKRTEITSEQIIAKLNQKFKLPYRLQFEYKQSSIHLINPLSDKQITIVLEYKKMGDIIKIELKGKYLLITTVYDYLQLDQNEFKLTNTLFEYKCIVRDIKYGLTFPSMYSQIVPFRMICGVELSEDSLIILSLQ